MTAFILMMFASMYKTKVAQFSWPHMRRVAAGMAFCLSVLLFCSRLDAFQGPPATWKSFGPPTFAEHPDNVFIEALLNRGLFRTAIEICTDRRMLANGPQTEAGAQWTMLLMESKAAEIGADPSILDSPESISKRLQDVRSLAFPEIEVPRSLWLQSKYQWCRWFLLQRTLAAYRAVSARTALRDWSLAAIRESLDELDLLALEIRKAPDRSPSSGGKSNLTVEQWTNLVNDVYLLQADILLLRAMFYPAKSTERIAAATEMLSSIEKALQRISTEWAGRPNLDIARCNALIHLDRAPEAIRELTALRDRLEEPSTNKPKQSNQWKVRIAVLAAEACRNADLLDQSQQWIESVGGWTQSPDVAIEHFANLVAQASDPSKLIEALQVKNEIGNRFGTYWQQRADAILVSKDLLGSGTSNGPPSPAPSVPSDSGSNIKVELLMSEAKQLLAAKQWQQAINKLNQAEFAAAITDHKKALDIALATAAVLEKLGQTEQAESELHRASIAYKNAPKAPDAALRSVWSSKGTIAADLYQLRLKDIIETWPQSQQAETSLAKMEAYYLSGNQLPELLGLWIMRLDLETNEQTQKELEPHITGIVDRTLARYGLARLVTREGWFDNSNYDQATLTSVQKLLDEMRSKLIEKSSSQTRAGMEAYLESLQVESRWSDKDLSRTNSGGQLRTLDYLLQNSTTENVFTNDELANLALSWMRTERCFQQLLFTSTHNSNGPTGVEDLQKSLEDLRSRTRMQNEGLSPLLGPVQQIQFERALQLYDASLQCWSNRLEPGIAALMEARKGEPRNPWWIYNTARVLQTIPTQRETAIQLFRTFANGFEAGTDPWLEARARTVQTMRLIGNTQAATELSNLVLQTYPSISSEWKSRFNDVTQ